MRDLKEYPNQKYGWVKETDGSWSLYAPDGTKVIGTAGKTVQVPTPVGATDAATKAYADSHGGGGGSTPIGLILLAVLDLHALGTGTHHVSWSEAIDNIQDFNDLTELPAGLGLELSFDGSSADITVIEHGTWASSMAMPVPVDATLGGSIGLIPGLGDAPFGPGIPDLSSGGNAQYPVTNSNVLEFKPGAVIQFFVEIDTAPTSNPCSVFPQLGINRIN